MTSASALARHLVAQWVAWGVEHVVLCPGSRSAPLAFAALAAEQRGELTLHTRIDERTAAFLALGIAKSSHRPAVVFTTSGTAAAHLHAAVLEASHAGVPLVAVTADRPAVLRGTGANQTTDQVGLFGDAADFVDLATPRRLDAPRDRPLHVNVQLTEPLTPDDAPLLTVLDGGGATHLDEESEATPARRTASLPLGPRTVVVAGDDAGPPARILAQDAGWPLLAEPSSGSRTGDHPIRTYRLLLDSPLGERIERVVVHGHPTLSRPVSRLLSRPGVEVVSVRARGRWPDRPHHVSAEHDAVRVEGRDRGDWLEQWRAADAELSARLDALLDVRGLGPHAVAAEVSAAVPPGGLLFVGASNPIRDLDLMAVSPTPGQHRKVLANRGLAGIDGTLSSAIGAALTRSAGARNLVLVGDVTFLHDLTALVLGPDEARPDLTIVVVNDGGGSIFATLEQGDPAYADSFERLFATPHRVDLAGLCASVGVPHWRVGSREELRHALAAPHGGIEVVEAVVPRHDRRDLDRAIRDLVATS